MENFLSQIVHNTSFSWDSFCIVACVSNNTKDNRLTVPDDDEDFIDLDIEDIDWDDFEDLF